MANAASPAENVAARGRPASSRPNSTTAGPPRRWAVFLGLVIRSSRKAEGPRWGPRGFDRAELASTRRGAATRITCVCSRIAQHVYATIIPLTRQARRNSLYLLGFRRVEKFSGAAPDDPVAARE